MKKTRKAIPLTQRIVRKLLRRPQTLTGFEIAVTSTIDALDGGTREGRSRRCDPIPSALKKGARSGNDGTD